MYYLIDTENDEVVGVGKTRELAIENFTKEYNISEYDKAKLALTVLVKPMKIAITVVEAK